MLIKQESRLCEELERVLSQSDCVFSFLIELTSNGAKKHYIHSKWKYFT